MKLLTLLLVFFSPTAFADMPSTHGMLVFGKSKIYISHLPMFHAPHDYQMIAEVELAPAMLQAYQASLSAHPADTVYTLVPEDFVLPEMAAHPKPFAADLYHGHFERGGEQVASANVKIKKVLFFRKFVPGDTQSHFSYLLFGDAKEAFVAHFIVAKPDFDQIFSASAPLTGAETVVPHDAGKNLSAGASVQLGGIDVQLLRELYFETRDLAH